MAFSAAERQALLALKGVGPTVVKRFEEVGIDSFSLLAQHEPQEIAQMVAAMLHSSCWKNNPKALASVKAAIGLAKLGR
ncbi:helix-hairpin-helix domain-containing protein [Gilvimarinus sp. DA14]|uniref:helix-hairpin-helix domain-containing protein n=1 Tax=Gilvimarinus sp. DA14 TaxID=2956798 RepID=UPI0020B7A31F|nr:helix-hairpin-helix domain-containing protein [Gilvimarinus sp. DA14]UTF58990.1 helix-hairpin-helix domain-containing protein [Gilvimarinus sp. DA14]